MSLRKQLLVFGLLTLALPLAGWRYVREMEDVLRSGLERALLERAGTVGAALERQALLDRPSRTAPATGSAIYAPLLAAQPRVDGSRDDWSLGSGYGDRLPGGEGQYRAGVYERSTYFVIEVADDSIVYQQSPGRAPYGDRIVLLLAPAEAPQWLLLTTAAPGVVRAQGTAPPLFVPNGTYDDRVEAAWREVAGGYSVELRVPSTAVGSAAALAVIDVDARGAGFEVTIRPSWDADTLAPGRLIRERGDIEDAIGRFGRLGDRYRVLDTGGWIVGSAGAVRRELAIPARASVLEPLLRRILRRDDPGYAALEDPRGYIADASLRRVLDGQPVALWYRGSAEREAVVVAAVPLIDAGAVAGALLLEQASDAILSASDQALLRLMVTTLGVVLFVVLGMLGFATWLSYRVGRLARAAERSLSPQGEISAVLPGTRARDELGALARSFTDLLERLRDYTDYLRTLRAKLSHELRTPLAVVATSLENLETEGGTTGAYVQRLRQGVDRLDAILAAMSEATHIEQAIESATTERFDLDAVVGECAQAYADVYEPRTIVHRGLGREAIVSGSPELVSQLLDKLVDNAASFSAPDGCVRIRLDETPAGYRVAVENTGPLLPEAMRTQLFDSLVSLREHKGDKPHLGLGLYIAALIARFHRARIDADNLEDRSGVRVVVVFPRSGS